MIAGGECLGDRPDWQLDGQLKGVGDLIQDSIGADGGGRMWR